MSFQTEYDLSRFYPQMFLPEVSEQGAAKLSEARILIIGAGRTGIAAIMRLAESGTGIIGIADQGKAEMTGLMNHISYESRYAGKLKSYAASDRVKAINPDCRVNIYNLRITPDNIMDIVPDYDIVIDCTDNQPAHFLAGDATELSDIPLVSATAAGVYGQVSVFNYNGGPAYRSLFQVTPSVKDAGVSDVEVIPEHIRDIIGAILACEAIKIATGEGEILSSRILRVDAKNLRGDISAFSQPENYQPAGILGDYGFDRLTSVRSFSPYELKRELDEGQEVTLYDIRTAEDFNMFNIGGTNVKAEFLLNNPETLPASGTIVIICDTGDESVAVAEYLQNDAGFSNIFSLEGGIRHWRETMA